MRGDLNTKMMHKPTVFIIDDDLGTLKALEALLESVGLNVECFASSISFLENYDSSRYGCIITDLRMPIMGGMQMLEELKLRKNKLPVIMLTGYGDIHIAVNAMKIGVMDFIPKPFNNEYLLEQIQKSIARSMQQNSAESFENDAKRFSDLTKREQQVMKLVVAGKLNKQIADELCICTSTVEFHRSKMMKKMGAKNLAQLVKISFSLQK